MAVCHHGVVWEALADCVEVNCPQNSPRPGWSLLTLMVKHFPAKVVKVVTVFPGWLSSPALCVPLIMPFTPCSPMFCSYPVISSLHPPLSFSSEPTDAASTQSPHLPPACWLLQPRDKPSSDHVAPAHSNQPLPSKCHSSQTLTIGWAAPPVHSTDL